MRGGTANVCQALYMPALVAGRFNPDLKTQIPAARRNRKADRDHHYRRHAKARRHRKCSDQNRSPLDTRSHLIITDTLMTAPAAFNACA
ncbi:hypothetical protein [Sphingobium sp. HWE2-09]|uniref:hypothetical protein n=1 Tax=Sphingobium sp. HWE2-09 TaxID=3108390 RepID=UPI00403E864C